MEIFCYIKQSSNTLSSIQTLVYKTHGAGDEAQSLDRGSLMQSIWPCCLPCPETDTLPLLQHQYPVSPVSYTDPSVPT